MHTRSAARAASAMRRASTAFAEKAFSVRTCLPASRAFTVHSQCRVTGRGTYTASISGSSTTAS